MTPMTTMITNGAMATMGEKAEIGYATIKFRDTYGSPIVTLLSYVNYDPKKNLLMYQLAEMAMAGAMWLVEVSTNSPGCGKTTFTLWTVGHGVSGSAGLNKKCYELTATPLLAQPSSSSSPYSRPHPRLR